MDGAPDDTICAIATPVGEGGIGIIRISGVGALSVAEKIVRLHSGRSLGSLPSHTLHLADVVFAEGSSSKSEQSSTLLEVNCHILDEALVVYMAGPRSFTAEDVVEIHCHGSAVVLGRVCEACIVAGARLAQPGEFTKRAFLNGRLDLSQAEAVLDTIRAKSEAGLKVAQRHLRGDLGLQVGRLRTRLLAILAHVEAGIDFVEEDIAFIGRDELMQSLQETLGEIQAMLATAKRGRLLREGARVVILGRPNAGKSSLLNSLLQEDRAIVTPIPGTTRDVIEEVVVWEGLTLTLVDTAGLRETTDVVEQEGIRRTRAAQDNADVILYILDASELTNEIVLESAQTLPAVPTIVLINKIDLVNSAVVDQLVDSARRMSGCEVIPISVGTGFGLDHIKWKLLSLLSQGSLESSEGVVVTNVRHSGALERAAASLREALVSTERQVEPEFVAVDLREAGNALGEITGAITSDELLDRIFSEFCIGK